jgi:hypothetical protein
MSTCHRYPTKAEAIEGFCDEFEGFCSVTATGVKSVPADVEKSILFDTDSTNDYNDCDGGFDFDLACPTACGRPQTTVTATYRVVADAFGEGAKECPYHDGFVMERTCPATEPCAMPCEGSWTSPPCPTACGTPASTPSKTWTMTTPAQNEGSCPNTGPAPTYSCPATAACPADCTGGSWSYTCPTECGYGGGNVTATLVGYTPAVGTGSCTTTKSVYCPATSLCTVDLTYFNSLFKQWGDFVGDYSTIGNLVTPKTSQKSLHVRSYYDPYPNWIQGFMHYSDQNGMCSGTTRNFHFKEPTGKLIRGVTCSIKWLAGAYRAGNVTPKKYRIYSKLYGSTEWTLRGDYNGASSAGVDVTTTWTVSEPSIEYRMEVYEWHPSPQYGCYYYISSTGSEVSYYDTYYDVALSGYDGYVVVSGITISLRGMGIRYDDVETIVSFEIRGLNKSGEDVVVYSETSNESRNFSASINSSTIVKGVYVRLKLGRSTGRGDYMGETHDLSIEVQAVKQI